MAGKLPKDRDKGRCSRCCLSYKGKPPKRGGDYPAGNICFRYGDYCNRVAWNCNAPSSGFRRTDVDGDILQKLDIAKAV